MEIDKIQSRNLIEMIRSTNSINYQEENHILKMKTQININKVQKNQIDLKKVSIHKIIIVLNLATDNILKIRKGKILLVKGKIKINNLTDILTTIIKR